MKTKYNIVAKLTAKDDKSACAFADKIILESHETDKWYEYFDDIAALLNHPKSLVRNRALNILAANARWDEDNRFDLVISNYLSHITDQKPLTARQCIKALAQVGVAKPQYIPIILSALHDADLSKYKDSMLPLIEKDIAETERVLTTYELSSKIINTNKISYEPASIDDADLLVSIYNSAFYSDYVRYGECPGYGKTKEMMEDSIRKYNKFIICTNDKPVGVLSCNKTQDGVYEIGCLCVIPEYQRKGIGTLAIKFIFSHYQDGKKFTLVTPSDKEENIRFYTDKCGFYIVSSEKDGNVNLVRLERER